MYKNGVVQLRMMTDGDRTVAEAVLHTYQHPSTAAVASSGRERGDESDEKIGEALAIARALRSLASKLEKQAAGKMKHREDCKAHARDIKAKMGLKRLAEMAAVTGPAMYPPPVEKCLCGHKKHGCEG